MLVFALVPLLLSSAPFWTRALQGADATSIVRVAPRDSTALAHLAEVLPRLHEPVGGILGTHVPVVADSEDFVVRPPGWMRAGLVLLYGLLLILAVRAARIRHPSALLLLAVGLTLLAFPFPARAAPHTIRFLTPLYLPVAALVVWAVSPRGTSRWPWVAVLALAVVHLTGATALLGAWRTLDRAEAPFLLPDLVPVREALDERGVRRAYASYGPAWRLTWESGERIVASQPWNERFRHWPLPRLDDVRFAKNVAWVLTPADPHRPPAAPRLRRDHAKAGRAVAARRGGPGGDLPRLRAPLLAPGRSRGRMRVRPATATPRPTSPRTPSSRCCCACPSPRPSPRSPWWRPSTARGSSAAWTWR